MELVVEFLRPAQFMCDHASKVLGRTLFQDGQPASRGHRRITIGHKQILDSRRTPRHVYDGAFFPLKPLVDSNRFRAPPEDQWTHVKPVERGVRNAWTTTWKSRWAEDY